MSRQITPSTTLENLKREAKRWLKALQANVEDARARLVRAFPDAPHLPTLRDVQHALAREHGLAGWTAPRDRLADEAPLRRYERVADALVIAYRTGEIDAMRIVWDYFGHMRAWQAMRRYVRLDLGKTEQPLGPDDDDLTLDEARYLVARAQDFESWDALVQFAASLPVGKRNIAAKAVAAFAAGDTEYKIPAARSRDWDEILAVMQERRLAGLGAMGQMTDALLERVSRLDQISALDLSGSAHLTDAGLRHLARLTGLRHLDLGGCSSITDRGLEVLRQLPSLETLSLAWTRITDAGAAHLTACEHLRTVNLGGTATGDGAIRALAAKRSLHELHSGNAVSDAGLALLRQLPVFSQWQGDDDAAPREAPDNRPNLLSLRGSFTDHGMAQLVGLDGLYALDLDNDRLSITGAGLAPLVALSNLAWLGFDAKDDSMSYIAALPRLRFLMCQDTTAGDEGFVALSRSRSIEHIWGRRCYNLRRRGFMALSAMPALRYLSVSCKNVDDVGLSALPHFPALRELMPIDVPDDGYRHVGRAEGLESLVLMYCRDTTDVATQHITALPRLRKYFASYNRITDRTPEMLSEINSLESVIFDSCSRLTNAGIAALVRLPELRELNLSGMPKVTDDVIALFPSQVHVRYWR